MENRLVIRINIRIPEIVVPRTMVERLSSLKMPTTIQLQVPGLSRIRTHLPSVLSNKRIATDNNNDTVSGYVIHRPKIKKYSLRITVFFCMSKITICVITTMYHIRYPMK